MGRGSTLSFERTEDGSTSRKSEAQSSNGAWAKLWRRIWKICGRNIECESFTAKTYLRGSEADPRFSGNAAAGMPLGQRSLSSFPESGLVLGQGLVAVLPCLVIGHVFFAECLSAVFALSVLFCLFAALVALCHLREIPMGLDHLLV